MGWFFRTAGADSGSRPFGAEGVVIKRDLAFATVLFAAILLASLVYSRATGDHAGTDGLSNAIDAPEIGNEQEHVSAKSEVHADPVAEDTSLVVAPPPNVPLADALTLRTRELESSASTDPDSFLALEMLRGLCREWVTESVRAEPSERIAQPEWGIVDRFCADGAGERFDAILSSADRERMVELFPEPSTYSAQTAEEFASRDARLQERMRRTSSPAGALNAAIVYFDYERFAQWAGPLLPTSLYDDRSYRSSRIGLDVAWMYACRLGFDCGPYAALTLNECWQTPGCVPGGAARQVVQMRRSPLELRLVDSMVNRLLAERAAGGP